MSWHKTSFPDPAAALFEAEGLNWLADVPGGVRVVQVHHAEPGRLELEQIRSGPGHSAAAAAFGADLARTHAAGATHFGQVAGGGAAFIGLAQLPVPAAGRERGSWGAFYAEDRVLPFVRRAVDQGLFTTRQADVVEGVANRLIDGVFDHDQPALVTGPVARLHGDLWSGNVLWDADAGGQAVLIDPAAHGGHAETDLAMLALFGLPHLQTVIDAYTETSPLADGWAERIELHQLHPLLVHTVLFGGSYAQATLAAAHRYT